MKQLFIFLLCSIPLLLPAQFKSGLTIKVFPTSTATKLLIPVGLEIQPNASYGILAEISIPFNRNDPAGDNGRVFKVGSQFRYYFIEEKKFRNYWAVEIAHRSEKYSKNNSAYYISETDFVKYDYAEIKSVASHVGILFGGQRVFSNRFIFEWNLGIGVNRKSVGYAEVDEYVPSPFDPSGDPFGIGDSLNSIFSGFGNSSKKDESGGLFSPFSDKYEKTKANVALLGNLRIGYLLVSK